MNYTSYLEDKYTKLGYKVAKLRFQVWLVSFFNEPVEQAVGRSKAWEKAREHHNDYLRYLPPIYEPYPEELSPKVTAFLSRSK